MPPIRHTPARFSSTGTHPDYPDRQAFSLRVRSIRSGLSWRKQEKAMISLAMLGKILTVLRDPSGHHESPQFRWWVRLHFALDATGFRVLHDDLPVVVEEDYYDVLRHCHAVAVHGGRDRTHDIVRANFSWLPKHITAEFVNLCPTCVGKRCRKRAIAPSHARPRRSATETQQQSLTSGTQPLITEDILSPPNHASSDVESEVPAMSPQPSGEDLLAYSTPPEFTLESVENINDRPTTTRDQPSLTSEGTQGPLEHFATSSDIHLFQEIPECVQQQYSDWEARQILNEYVNGGKIRAIPMDDETFRKMMCMDEAETVNESPILPYLPNTHSEGTLYNGNDETMPTSWDNGQNTLTPFSLDTRYIDPVPAAVEPEVTQEQTFNGKYYVVDCIANTYNKNQFTADSSVYLPTIAAENASRFVPPPGFDLNVATASAPFQNYPLVQDWNLVASGGINPSHPHVSFGNGSFRPAPPYVCYECRSSAHFRAWNLGYDQMDYSQSIGQSSNRS